MSVILTLVGFVLAGLGVYRLSVGIEALSEPWHSFAGGVLLIVVAVVVWAIALDLDEDS